MVDYEAFKIVDALMIVFYCLWAFYLCFLLSKYGKFHFYNFLLLSLIHFITTLVYLPSIKTDALRYFRIAFESHKSLIKPILGQGTDFVNYYLYYLIHFFNLSYTGCYFLCSAIGLTGYFLIINTVVYLIKKYNLYYTKVNFYILLLPGLHYWNVALGKDSIVFFSIALFFSGIIRKNYISIIIGVFGVGIIRSPVLVLFIAGLALGNIMLNKKISLIQKSLIALISAILIIQLIPVMHERLKLQSFEVEDVNSYIEYRLQQNQGGTSSIDMSDAILPVKLLSFLFRPLFFDAYDIKTLVVSIENIIWLGMVLTVLRNFTKKITSMDYSPVFGMLFFSFFLPVIAQSTTLTNLGIAVRMKTMYFTPLLILVFLSYDYKVRLRIKEGIKKRNYLNAKTSLRLSKSLQNFSESVKSIVIACLIFLGISTSAYTQSNDNIAIIVNSKEGIVSVSAFGLRGDGSNEYDRFKYMSNWINSHPDQVKELIFEPDKAYFISKKIVNSVITPDDINFINLNNIIINGQGSTIELNGNYIRSKVYHRSARILFKLCKNLTIKNLTINGHRELTTNDPSFINGKTNNIQSTGHNFGIQACENVKLINCISLNAIGDGFNIASEYEHNPRIPSRNVKILNCKAYYSARQGITIGQVVNITVENSEFSYTGQGPITSPYFAPVSGCDIEPDWVEDGQNIRVQENTKNIYIKNCSFIGNLNAQFICGGDPRKYSNIHVDSCYFSDDDPKKGYYGKGLYCINLKSSIIFENSIIIAKHALISLAKFSKSEPLLTSEIIFRNNKVTYGATQLIASSSGMKSILIENNRFIGVNITDSGKIKSSQEFVIDLNKNGNAVWRNNYVFIPKEKYKINKGNTFSFARFDSWIIENPQFHIDSIINDKAIIDLKFKIIIKNGALKESESNPPAIIFERDP